MTLAGLLNQPLTIQRRGVVSTDPDYGNDVPGTTSTVATVGYVEQTVATEIIVDRETYVTDWLVVLPAGTAVDASDRIVHGSKTLEVIGSPHEAWNPRRAMVSQVECRCRETAG
jgi:hypothetical protein